MRAIPPDHSRPARYLSMPQLALPRDTSNRRLPLLCVRLGSWATHLIHAFAHASMKRRAGGPGSFLFFPLDGIHGSKHITPGNQWGVTKRGCPTRRGSCEVLRSARRFGTVVAHQGPTSER